MHEIHFSDVFDGYPEFHHSLLPKNSVWVFNQPFHMFVGRWVQLSQYEAHSSGLMGDFKAAWVALINAMTPIVQSTLDSIEQIKDTGLVLWKDLPLIFPPGKLIIIEELGVVQSVARVLETRTTPASLGLDYEYIDWDGETRGFNVKTLSIPCYGGHKKVRLSDLKAMPLEFCPTEEELRATLIARGRRWGSLNGVEYKQFGGKKVPIRTGVPIEVSTCIDLSGPSHFTSWSANEDWWEQASGSIMIDASAYFDKNPSCRSCGKPELEPFEVGPKVQDEVSEASLQLSDEHCLLASGTVHGFDMKTKDWCK